MAAFRSYDEFLRDFQAVFEHSKGGKGAEDLLLELAQDGLLPLSMHLISVR